LVISVTANLRILQNPTHQAKVEVLETVRIRRFAYEKWVYFFEIFYVDGEEEIVMRRSGFIFFCPIDNFQEFFKVQSKFNPLTAP
jgi:hypothetical protein